MAEQHHEWSAVRVAVTWQELGELLRCPVRRHNETIVRSVERNARAALGDTRARLVLDEIAAGRMPQFFPVTT